MEIPVIFCSKLIMSITGTTSKNLWPFSPQSIAGLTLWLDAADQRTLSQNTAGTTPVTAAGQQVQFWADKSGNGRNATSSDTAMTYNTTGIGNPSIAFSGSQTVGFQVNVAVTDSTYFFVVNNAGSPNDVRVYSSHKGPTNNKQNWWYNTYRTQMDYAGRAGLQGPTNTNGLTLIMTRQDTSSTGLLAGWQNGTSIGTATTTAVIGETFTSFILGTDNGGATFPMVGFIAETLVYNSVLATDQRQQVEGYLAQKWGLQADLPVTHPYYATSTMQLYKQPVFQRTFQPIDIPGCALWLDAADQSSMTFSGSNVTQWNDKSGAGNHATIGGGSSLPATLTTAGMVFTRSSDTVGTFFNLNTPYSSTHTVFIVATPTSPSAVFLYGRGFTDSSPAIITNWTSTQLQYYDNGQFLTFGSPTSTYISSFVRVFGSGGTVVGRLNGSQAFSDTTKVTEQNASAPWSILGGSWVSSGVQKCQYSGTISEFMIFSNALTTAQSQQVEGYLAWKWGLVSSIASGHPGKTLPAFSTIFNPKSLTGCTLWLDGADRSSMVFSGTTVTTWNDKSGNGLHATATGTPTYTSNALNGLGAPALNSNANFFKTPTFIISPTVGTPSIFMIMNQTAYSGSGNSDFFQSTNSWQRLDFFGQGNSFNVAVTMNNAGPTVINATTTSNNPTLLSFVVNTASGGVGFANGTFTATVGSAGGLLVQTDTYSIGGGPGFVGFIYELIVFNNTVSTSQRQQVEGYLAWKWGLQNNLPSSHAYKKIKP